MPTVNVSLGKFVTVRPRADGTFRVLFELPPRLRPSDWSPTTPLPRKGKRTGDLTDAGEIARIRADADELYQAYLAARIEAAPQPRRRTMKALVDYWETTQGFKATKPRTRAFYLQVGRQIIEWSEHHKNPDPAKLSREVVENFLSLYDEMPTRRRHMKVVLKMLMDQAIALQWRSDNPAAKIRMKVPEPTVNLWEAPDVERYSGLAMRAGLAALAAVILTEWEIGQRLTDVRLFRFTDNWTPTGRQGPEYDASQGVFRFWQSKTRSYVTIPVSAPLQATLAACRRDGTIYLFTDAETGKPYSETALSHAFQEIRDGARKDGEAILVLRALRHSCVVQLARAGCTIPEIASITGHSLASVHAILAKYLPRDNEVAWEAQAKRGLIPRKEAGTGV
ncbi:MAG: hypothetical protein WA840_20550 [Caulobacteraceae bacterium]